jgi:hypothetical protein
VDLEVIGSLIRAADEFLALVQHVDEQNLSEELLDLRSAARALRKLAYLVMANANPDQAWFWTEDWQAGEREADDQIAAGHTTFHTSTDDFLAAMDARRPDRANP